MAENNPASWPPPIPAGETKTAKLPANNVSGWISLAMALAGIVFLIAPLVMPKPPVPALPLMAIEIVWWVSVLVTGIIGRRSVPGKIGLGVCLFFIVLVAIITVWLVAQHAAAPVSAPTAPSLPSK